MIPLEKAIRRKIPHPSRIGGDELVVQVSRAGVSFWRPRSRHRLELSWRDVYQLAEHRAGELAHRETLRDRVVGRLAKRAAENSR